MENLNMENLTQEEIQSIYAQVMQQAFKKQAANKYDVDSKGNIKNTTRNLITFLNTDEKTKGRLKYNQFLQRKEYDGEEYTDFVASSIRVQMADVLGFEPVMCRYEDAINNKASQFSLESKFITLFSKHLLKIFISALFFRSSFSINDCFICLCLFSSNIFSAFFLSE